MASLFESPSENLSFNLNKCLMAKTSEDYAARGSKWVLDSGCTSHMTGGKDLVMELRPNLDKWTITLSDNSKSKVLGLVKVVVAHNITLVDVMLVKTPSYNLLSFYALGKMGLAIFIDINIVVLLWSKTLKVAFVGYTWVYFLKKKDETQQIFINFATEVQRQHNLTIFTIRSDNGSEFKNYTLNDFLNDEGIRHQYSAVYTPQQNGVAERKNRTLMDMARDTVWRLGKDYALLKWSPQQAPDLVDNVTPTEEQAQDRPSCEQDQGQDQPNEIDGEAPSVEQEQPNDDGATPSDFQDQPHDDEQTQEVEKAQIDGQDGD
ncbi:hypothetical protein QYE76_027611 [Lolium multiflorum]|uniref:Integrase catalytic domain-containing protein n=1 Tax=Lolium multiflorum TaxID=4521 RepID=A0AAD8QJF0_LOLMU|nr:hypothetical protein QYE76_027611 [Lolium multiflorum]